MHTLEFGHEEVPTFELKKYQQPLKQNNTELQKIPAKADVLQMFNPQQKLEVVKPAVLTKSHTKGLCRLCFILITIRRECWWEELMGKVLWLVQIDWGYNQILPIPVPTAKKILKKYLQSKIVMYLTKLSTLHIRRAGIDYIQAVALYLSAQCPFLQWDWK
jgi:hypothetical protein